MPASGPHFAGYVADRGADNPCAGRGIGQQSATPATWSRHAEQFCAGECESAEKLGGVLQVAHDNVDGFGEGRAGVEPGGVLDGGRDQRGDRSQLPVQDDDAGAQPDSDVGEDLADDAGHLGENALGAPAHPWNWCAAVSSSCAAAPDRREFTVTDQDGRTVLTALPRTSVVSPHEHDYAVHQPTPGRPHQAEVIAIVQTWRMVKKSDVAVLAATTATAAAPAS